MNGKSAYTIVPPPPRVRAVEDEWGMFDPNQAGLKAPFRAVRALSEPAVTAAVPEPSEHDDAGFELGAFDDVSSLARPDAAAETADLFDAPPATALVTLPEPIARDHRTAARLCGPARVVSHVVARNENVYDLTDAQPPRARSKPERGTVYSLEFPTQCPLCCKEISTVRVSRLMRTQVSFTSTLPRKGYIIVCPECEGILSAELSGLI